MRPLPKPERQPYMAESSNLWLSAVAKRRKLGGTETGTLETLAALSYSGQRS